MHTDKGSRDRVSMQGSPFLDYDFNLLLLLYNQDKIILSKCSSGVPNT